jgi:hypothetical protein
VGEGVGFNCPPSASQTVVRNASDKKEMKGLFRLLILLTLSTSGLSQAKTDSSYGMTTEKNKDWLVKVSKADKELQLSLVKGRLIENRKYLNQADKLDAPVLIIDGIPIEDNIDERQKEFLKNQLTVMTVDLKVVEKEPEGLYVNKAFTGIILMVIMDKKTDKKFNRLR